MAKTNLTAQRLRELFNYDQQTGLFTRIIRRQSVHVGDTAGSKTTKGYLSTSINGASYKLHRLAWLYAYDKWPTGQIDHINGNRTDNRICNLRDVPQSLNKQNQRAAQRRNKSGFLGVSANGSGWRAAISCNGVYVHLGTFATAELAHSAYIFAKRKMHPGCTI